MLKVTIKIQLWQKQNTTRVILTDPVEAVYHHCIVFIVLAFIKSDLLA